MSRAAALSALVAAAEASGYYKSLWGCVLDGATSTASRHMDKTRPEKRSRNSSHKQNARKARKGRTR